MICAERQPSKCKHHLRASQHAVFTFSLSLSSFLSPFSLSLSSSVSLPKKPTGKHYFLNSYFGIHNCTNAKTMCKRFLIIEHKLYRFVYFYYECKNVE